MKSIFLIHDCNNNLRGAHTDLKKAIYFVLEKCMPTNNPNIEIITETGGSELLTMRFIPTEPVGRTIVAHTINEIELSQ